MKNATVNTKYQYFLAANSAFGFKNYFNELFIPENFDKLFIIKGGPGTGKSSLMKRAALLGETCGFEVEAIFCSSDVTSLDGVCLSKNGIRVGLVDGTAPHLLDPKLPGAVDEIVNLGVGWSDKALKTELKNIKEYNKLKSEAYRKAYEKLSFSYIFHRKLLAEYNSHFDFIKCRNEILNLLSNVTKGEQGEQIRLISAFSKLGFTRLETVKKITKRLIKIGGSKYSSMLFLNEIRAYLKNLEADFLSLLSPYNPEYPEAIYLPEEKIFITNVTESPDISADSFLISELPNGHHSLSLHEDEFTDAAKQELIEASKYHFLLEDIYKSAMDFGKIEEISEGVIERCKKILSHTP